ncbi:general transcription factor IIH subunit 4 [Lingula anatina]|uniref:General transcription factor IIH subunit 4 n=1 Tax=Lingula anatina TaxID=7574 RepID=A0A1S3I9V8_LINAN|nr:general transcription factor IIH subunit 4 [Lingula anatina]|eukprot:XP_013394189.1 general transcription factor IIH subunit 4 [Lingula anatina]
MATLSTRKIVSKDLHDYLGSLSPGILNRLYSYPATCLAVFRELPCLARHYVMRILFVEQPVPQAVVSSWVENKHQEEHQQACQVLSELRVWQNHQLPGGLTGWMLNETYRWNLKTALLGGGTSWTSAILEPDKYAKDIPFLDSYAMERWECVLHFMVASKEAVSGVSRDVVDILLHGDLMRVDESDSQPMITASGFQFLLMDTASQVWFFMLQYLDTVESRGMDIVEALSFLFQLSFSTLGKDYSTEGMSESQLKFLQHLREFGLVFQRKRKAQRFYPTRLAVNLATGVSKTSTATDMHRPGYIVVETNYRVYAYTESSLQYALLALFCEMLYRFPNFVVAQVTRDSVRQALMSGISAEQIINFLRSHAHPESLKQNPVIPSTITDQIRLWELERDRFKFTDGVLYNQFLSQTDFELLRDYARDIDVLVWENPQKRTMVVTRGGHDDVKKFWKRQRSSNS